MRHEFWNIPNVLSLSRLLLAVPFALVMLSPLEHARVWGLGILLLGALTDKLDGVFARQLHLETEWGRILDPLADKVGVGTAAVILTVLGDLPVWFVAILLGRDLLILIGGLVLKQKTGVVLPSNITGKWTVGIFSLTLLFALMKGPEPTVLIFIIMSIGMSVVSTALYVQRFLLTLGGDKRL